MRSGQEAYVLHRCMQPPMYRVTAGFMAQFQRLIVNHYSYVGHLGPHGYPSTLLTSASPIHRRELINNNINYIAALEQPGI
jgi:hypothetical protein